MSDSYPFGGGGGPAGADVATTYAFDKPYDLYGPWSQEMADQINEMFGLLFKADTKTSERVGKVETKSNSGEFEVQLTLTNTQMRLLSSQPIFIVPALGTGKLAIIRSFIVYLPVRAVSYAANSTFELRYGTSVGQLAYTTIVMNNQDTTDNRIGFGQDTATAGIIQKLPDTAIMLRTTADIAGAGSTANITKIYIRYTVIENVI